MTKLIKFDNAFINPAHVVSVEPFDPLYVQSPGVDHKAQINLTSGRALFVTCHPATAVSRINDAIDAATPRSNAV